MVDLSEGDFLYQSDQELFLVVTNESDESYTFAAHGWREIDKGRVDQYVEDSTSKIHRMEAVERLIDEEGDEQTKQQFNKLKQLFAVYDQAEMPPDGLQQDFALEER